MAEVSNLTVAIIFAKEDLNEFNRCSFPVLGRPVVAYPVLAALHAQRVDHVYVSTRSERIIQIVQALDHLKLIKREEESETIIEEFRRSVLKVIDDLGEMPRHVVLLLGNSPCILNDTIDNALEIFEKKPELDSVVTTVERHEFSPSYAFRLTEERRLEPSSFAEAQSYQYFVDARLIVVKTECILHLKPPFSDTTGFSAVYGEKIHPLFQEEGVADIDYAWQVPLVERWLQRNGFSEESTPYRKKVSAISEPPQPLSEKRTKQFKVFISTVPFGEIDPYPVNLLKENSQCEFLINPLGRKLKEHELAELLSDYNILIAGTEPITAKVMDNAPGLKLISRVGIGLDSVDLLYARKKGINVSYTPDAPAPAVAELTIGHMLNASRFLPLVDRKLREGVWQRIMGQRLSNQVVGIIGTGRVGSRVLKHLQGFSPKRILVNDIQPDKNLYDLFNAKLVDKEVLYRESDIITLHIPLTKETYPLITRKELEQMKPNAVLINTSRGGIIHEKALFDALKNKTIAAAAIDVFENEPYGGELTMLDNCYLSCHMGSCSVDCRFQMEKLATEEAIRFINGQELQLLVPEEEYAMRGE